MWTNEVRLPAEYQEVEYIQSSRTQVINTWVIPTTQTYTAELEVESTQSGAEYWAFGIWGTTGFRWWQDSSWHWDTSYWASYEPSSYNLNTKTKITMSNSWKWTSTDTAIWLFGMWENGDYANNRKWAYKIYYCKIFNNWILIRDFIPCYRKSDNVIWMYDLVNDVFYTNSWSWTFTKWSDVPDMVEHLVRPTQPTPTTLELYYDLRDGSLTDLQAAWFDWVWTTWSYTFTSDWLQQTSSSNDRGTWVIKRGLDLTNAKKLIAYHIWQWQYASWSNWKEIKLCTDIITSSNDISLTNPRWDTYFTYSNNSSYRNSELPYVNASWTSTALARGIATSASWEDTITLTIDFENKTIEWKVAWTNNYTLSANLTDEQYNATRNMTAIFWWRGRWYHTYDSYERLKEVYLKIEY